MQLIYKRLAPLFFILMITGLFSCKKGWLEAKPDKSLVVPSTIADYQALLDNTTEISTGIPGVTTGLSPFNAQQNSLGEVSAGDFYVLPNIFGSQFPIYQNAFTWEKDIYVGAKNIDDWNIPYKRVFLANVVLEGIEKIKPADNTEQQAWNNVKGAALFFRAYNHFDVAQEFCKSYDKNTAGDDPGIPIRLTSDFNQDSKRGTVLETYNQIIADLKEANNLLTVTLPSNTLYKNRPTKAAANAMLARVYLFMEEYDNAWQYADACLQQYNKLLDFDSVYLANPGNSPFLPHHDEVILNNTLTNAGIFFGTRAIFDSALYNSYHADDLRLKLFYRKVSNNPVWKGSYYGGTSKFSGLATDEIYLIRAECYARKGNTDAAMLDLNTLLTKRWKAGTFVSFTATDADDALVQIVEERRKELVFRGLRWPDLKRLNKDPRFAVTLTRTARDQTYTLPANDPKYVLPIPDDVIQLTGMAQNPR
jgi:starch-binding outer membrane protein, SusD/RagB family